MSNHLDLNKTEIKNNVISKLQLLGFEVNENTPIWEIRLIIQVIQINGGLMADGFIGKETMPLLGYRSKDIKKMLKRGVNL